jgi:hypothetical protein
MELAPQTTKIGPEQQRNSGPIAPPRRHSGKPTRPQLLTRDQLDGRTNAAKIFDKLVLDIETDLGGSDRLSTIERALIEGFAGAALTLYNLNTRLARGESIEFCDAAQALSAMVRVASRLGLSRRARAVDGLTLGDLVRLDDADRRAKAAAAKAATAPTIDADEAAHGQD